MVKVGGLEVQTLRRRESFKASLGRGLSSGLHLDSDVIKKGFGGLDPLFA